MSASDLRVDLGPILDAFAVPATVTRPAPDDTPISTRVIWMTPGLGTPSLLGMPGEDINLQRRERRRVMTVPAADVPTVPKNTRIECAEKAGGPVLAWRSDGIEYVDDDHRRVIVVPETEP